ncbi:MAG: HEAT repeat domain-containing protein [Chitinophagaceae bacterium]|uniref:HEAT repeat domain-containing protein n=1 Tax=unclassified Paraflavitalea TaxID=2798305 RepID=UPI003D33D0D8|nr:HEAT repeat domain-containing protein [Chitinophagaceae bacterium]
MFDFWKFYKGLLNRTDYFDNYWEQFPDGQHLQFKKETLSLLKDNIANKDDKGLANTLAVMYNDGADNDYTDILLQLLDEKWHTSEEDIISVLELIKDPKSVDKLYEVALDVPDYDDMRAIAKKCMWALSAINTSEAIQKLKLLEKVDDPIIKENAAFELEQVLKKN